MESTYFKDIQNVVPPKQYLQHFKEDSFSRVKYQVLASKFPKSIDRPRKEVILSCIAQEDWRVEQVIRLLVNKNEASGYLEALNKQYEQQKFKNV